jgi:hypothetical protein
VLGLAGLKPGDIEAIAKKLSENRPVPPLPGIDLAPLIRGEWAPHEVHEHDGSLRKGVLFITDDEITEPLPYEHSNFSNRAYAEFKIFNDAVEVVRHGTPKKPAVPLCPGPVKQPNHVRCVRTMDYKLARYFDPSGKEPQEWEMYDLKNDPNETTSLVHVHGSPPKAREKLPNWAHHHAVQQKADELALLLHNLEVRFLTV